MTWEEPKEVTRVCSRAILKQTTRRAAPVVSVYDESFACVGRLTGFYAINIEGITRSIRREVANGCPWI